MNEQELAWSGEHGNDYNRRSPGNEESNYQLFKTIFTGLFGGVSGQFGPIERVVELGAGTGANIRAMARIFTQARFHAVEVNPQACQVLATNTPADAVQCTSVLDWQPLVPSYDLVLTKGFLIHIAPENLARVYQIINRVASRWILLAEYYNPIRVPINYRGRQDLLWKGDFAGEMLDLFPDLHLADYGFAYRRDRLYPQDDITWFLLERR